MFAGEMWELVCLQARDMGVTAEKFPEDSPTHRILSKTIQHKVCHSTF